MSSDPPTPSGTPDDLARLRQVEDIYFQVAPLAPSDRVAALERLCGGDATLESEVRSLLLHADRIGGFLEQPALGRPWSELSAQSAPDSLPDDLVGATLGSFRVERRIAAGGMGAVYLASRSDGAFDQRVAIKVVRRGMDSEDILTRFRAERQTLAALNHPNIARLIDGGITPDGRPFLVMEYVDGRPIDEYCDARRLKISDRLRLFREVCDAVHHAHQNLIIHRDIKPTNILVTESGSPKLLDFGIAKLLAPDSRVAPVTADTDRRLTPEYASPEQVEGQAVTTATDIYSLGVVLYELLTGSRPYAFHARTHEELRRIVCDLVPPAPSQAVTVRVTRLKTDAAHSPPPTQPTPSDAPKTRGLSSTRLRSTLRGDLDNIALMALRKEPQRRYASAEQLAADITRYLDGMPVLARRDTLAYRASKFLRRHAAGTALTLGALVLLAGSSASLYEQRRELRAQRDQLLITTHQLDASRDFLLEILGGADTGNNGPDQTLGSLLNDAAAALESAPPQDPLTLAASRQALGRSFMSIGDLKRARTMLEAAEPVLVAHKTLATAASNDIRIDLAELSFFEGKSQEAEAAFRTLLAEERAHLGRTHSLREGTLLNDLGAALRAERRFPEAIAAQQEAIAIRAHLLGEKSLPVASSRNNLASSLLQNGDIPGAIEQFNASLSIRTAMLRADHPLIVRCKSNLGLAQIRAGNIDEAIALLQSAVDSWDRAFGPDHPGRVPASTSLAIALRRMQRQPEAIDVLNQALAWQHAHDASPLLIAATEANIALALVESGHDPEAMPMLEKTLPELAGSPAQAGIAKSAAESLAAIYDRAGRPKDAERVRSQIK